MTADRAPGASPEAPGFFDRGFVAIAGDPDLARGLRCMISFMAPLGLAVLGLHPVNMIYAAIAAQNLANVDVRGAYGVRLLLLGAMTVVLAGASAMGAVAGSPLPLALAAAALIALGAGLWRHLSSEYGPSLATASALLCYIAMAEKPGAAPALNHALAALVGGAWGTLLHVAVWPIRPQHPLRETVGEAWLAAAKTCTLSADQAAEAEFRTALDKAFAVLAGAGARRRRLLVERLDELAHCAGRLVQRVSAFHSAFEELAGERALAEINPAADTVMTVLGNLSRTVAVAVVSRQPAHVAAVDVRVERLRSLLGALRRRLAAQPDPAIWTTADATAGQIESYLPEIAATLRRTVSRADDQGAFSMELSDLAQTPLRPLVATLNLSRRPDPALIRYTGRILVLTLVGVWAMTTFQLPHGYWLPFTMAVVLQPDYGSTRIKAAQRLSGTLAGSLLGSALLWVHLPFAVLMAATALTAFIFGYFLRRNYTVAVIFITLFVVVLVESLGPVTLALTAERVADTAVGGLLALLAALVFWPHWERERFRPILARALRANAGYLRVTSGRLADGRPFDRDAVHAKRAAESANAAAFSSLQRMSGDPASVRGELTTFAAVANGNQRVTRALNLVALQRLGGGEGAASTERVREFAESRARALEGAAEALEGTKPTGWPPSGPVAPGTGLYPLERASAEIGAIILGVERLANPAGSAS